MFLIMKGHEPWTMELQCSKHLRRLTKVDQDDTYIKWEAEDTKDKRLVEKVLYF